MAEARNTISVIVPVYKAEAYLNRCVDSILGQVYEKLEIILVDDGSPDGCPALCDEYARGDGRIKVVHKENGGLVSAWQAGVKASTGGYLCFVDSDDWVEPDMLEDMSAWLSGGEGDAKEIVCCNFVIDRPDKETTRCRAKYCKKRKHNEKGIFYKTGKCYKKTKHYKEGEGYKETEHFHGLAPGVYEGKYLEGKIKDHLLGHENRKISMSRCMKLFSRSLIVDNMKYSNPGITMGEDVNITLPALLDCRRLVIMEGALYYHYFYNEISMVHKYDAGMYDGIQSLDGTVREIYRIKGRGNGRRQADREYVWLLLLALKNEIRGGRRGYAKRVRDICMEGKNRRIVERNPVKVRDRVNRGLYFILRYPVWVLIKGMGMVFRLGDKMRM